jgi:hypothetical protein
MDGIATPVGNFDDPTSSRHAPTMDQTSLPVTAFGCRFREERMSSMAEGWRGRSPRSRLAEVEP